ncbi:hypothetical protein BDW02DRAFT_485535, partial [Decorospora gaudefroyi]
GDKIQRSLEGLLRSLLYQVLSSHPDLIRHAFPAMDWLTGGPNFEFNKDTLVRGIRLMLEEASKHDIRIFFLIDGLDEFDDRYDDDDETSGVQDLLQILNALRSSSAVKLCVSSRPHNEFIREFGSDQKRHFKLQDLTRNDIRNYVLDTLERSTKSKPVSVRGESYASFIEEVINAAQGVLLWVALATTSISEGILNGDSIFWLRQRLQRLPRKLERLFQYILSTVDPAYRENCARSLLFATTNSDDTTNALIFHMYLDEAEISRCMESSRIDLEEFRDGESRMVKQLNAYCKGLLEVKEDSGSGILEKLYGQRVIVGHRTIAEFLRSEQ